MAGKTRKKGLKFNMPSKTKSNAKSSFLRGINMFYYKIKIKYNNSRISACGFSKKYSI